MDTILLVLLDLIAIAATAAIANRKHYVVGAIIGLVLEFIRIFIAMGIAGSPQSPGDLMVFLINFRIYNIPLLVGVGFFVASASSQQSTDTDAAQKDREVRSGSK